MDFAFGIEKESEIYCTAAKVSIKNHQGATLENILNNISSLMISEKWEDKPRTEVIHFIVNYVESSVKMEGWSLTDEDGVAWYMGVYCKSFIRSLRRRQESFDELFKECFVEYFKNK